MAFQPDEDFWLPRISPQLPLMPSQPLASDEPLAGASKIAFHSENAEWWVGVQQCAARFAIATLLAITSVATAQAIAVYSYRQEEPSGSLRGVPQEEYWQNAVDPISSALLWPSQSTFDVQEPAGNLHIQPEGDFWENHAVAVASCIYQPLPYFFSTDEVVPQPVLFQPDEDFWDNQVVPSASSLYQFLPYLYDSGEGIPFQPDEDFWQSPISYISTQNVWPQPFFDSADPAFGQFEESFWQNPVAPIQASNLYPQPFFDASETVSSQLDEDFWINPAPPSAVFNVWPEPWAFDGGDSIFFQPIEDYWISSPVPQVISWPQPFIGGADEETSFGVKVYYLADFNPYVKGIIRALIHIEGRAPVEFINGRFQTADTGLQEILDSKPGLASESEWRANYTDLRIFFGTSGTFPRS